MRGRTLLREGAKMLRDHVLYSDLMSSFLYHGKACLGKVQLMRSMEAEKLDAFLMLPA